jgi:hypothetical protein
VLQPERAGTLVALVWQPHVVPETFESIDWYPLSVV